MKAARLLTSILSILSFVWLLFLGYLEYMDNLFSVERGLSMAYAFILLICFLSIRISLISKKPLNGIVMLFALILIILGTLQWFNSMLIEHLGSYIIVVSMLLLGTSINTQLNGKGKMTMALKFTFLTTLIFIAIIALFFPRSQMLFEIASILLLLSTLGILVSIFFQKKIS